MSVAAIERIERKESDVGLLGLGFEFFFFFYYINTHLIIKAEQWKYATDLSLI